MLRFRKTLIAACGSWNQCCTLIRLLQLRLGHVHVFSPSIGKRNSAIECITHRRQWSVWGLKRDHESSNRTQCVFVNYVKIRHFVSFLVELVNDSLMYLFTYRTGEMHIGIPPETRSSSRLVKWRSRPTCYVTKLVLNPQRANQSRAVFNITVN